MIVFYRKQPAVSENYWKNSKALRNGGLCKKTCPDDEPMCYDLRGGS